MSDKRIEDRVDAAVEQSQAVGHIQRHRHGPPHAAVKGYQVGPQAGVHHQRYVVRHPTKQKRHNHRNDHLHGFVLLEPSSAQQPHNDDAVARDHDGQGQKEPKNVEKQPSSNSPRSGAAHVKVFWADHLLRVRVESGSVVEKGRQSEGDPKGPHCHAEEPAAQPLSAPDALVGPHNDKVPIDADARQEEDAGVEVGFDDKGEELAHEVSKDPSFDQRCSQKGDGQRHQTICYRQIKQVDIGWGQHPSPGEDHPSYDQVSRYGKNEDDCEEEACYQSSCVIHRLYLARKRLRIHHIGNMVVVDAVIFWVVFVKCKSEWHVSMRGERGINSQL